MHVLDRTYLLITIKITYAYILANASRYEMNTKNIKMETQQTDRHTYIDNHKKIILISIACLISLPTATLAATLPTSAAALQSPHQNPQNLQQQPQQPPFADTRKTCGACRRPRPAGLRTRARSQRLERPLGNERIRFTKIHTRGVENQYCDIID